MKRWRDQRRVRRMLRLWGKYSPRNHPVSCLAWARFDYSGKISRRNDPKLAEARAICDELVVVP